MKNRGHLQKQLFGEGGLVFFHTIFTFVFLARQMILFSSINVQPKKPALQPTKTQGPGPELLSRLSVGRPGIQKPNWAKLNRGNSDRAPIP